MSSSKRIVIGCVETAGIIRILSKAFKELGHDVTAISSKHQFYDFEYNIDPERLIYTFLKSKLRYHWLALCLSNSMGVLGNTINEKIKSLCIRSILSNTDVYIHVYHTILWEEERQLNFLKKKNKKIITLFLGSDIRDYPAFIEKYNITHWTFSEAQNFPGTEAKRKKLALHEHYSDAIFSVPDQSIFAKKPYFHLQVPMEVNKFTYHIPENDIPVVLHAPSNPEVKGTDLILSTLEELKKEGVCFELKLLKGLPHELLLKELVKADVLIDELVLHGPGFLSFEAMLSGCAVATKYDETSPACFRPPVYSINEYTIKDKLRTLLQDKALIKQLAQDGRDYAVKNNDSLLIAKKLLDSINSNTFDYTL